MMANINTLWARVLVDELVRCGVRHAVISPGSRSTPLTLAFARHADVVDHSVIDERSAGFFAIGLAQATGLPVVLVCTSGTAAANYLPAVTEAYHSQIPLIVLTADRPAWLRDSGAPQAMNQTGLFGGFVRWFHELADPEPSVQRLKYLRTTVDKAAWMAAEGPVHINVPLDKPLEPTPVAAEAPGGVGTLHEGLPEVAGRAGGEPWVRYLPDVRGVLGEALVEAVRRAQRPVIWAGAMLRDEALRAEVLRWGALGVPVVAEAASQLRFGQCPEDVLAVDHWLNVVENRESFRPDLVIHLGRAPINWPTQRWMASLLCPVVFMGPEQPHLHHNPEHLPGWHVVGELCSGLATLRSKVGRWDVAWRDAVVAACMSSGQEPTPDWGDAAVHEVMAQCLPDGAALFVSSSMPLRDLETQWRAGKDVRLFFNRGLNGIDGVLSSAFGVAKAWRGPTYVVIGDVAFSHDVGALQTAVRNGVTATVVVIDNGGGAIFGYLPVKSYEQAAFERHFATAPVLDMHRLCEAYGIDYCRVESRDGLAEALTCGQVSGLRVVHAVTPSSVPGRRPSGRPSVLEVSATQKTADTSDEPVVFLHGFSDTPAAFEHIRETFLTPTLAFVLPGHAGQTEACDWQSALLRLRAFLEGRRAHLVGYSMGGRLALSYAATYPEDVLSLVVVGAHAGLPEEEKGARAAADEALAELADRDLETFLTRWEQTPILNLRRQEPGVVHAKASRRRTNRGSGLADALRQLGPAKMPAVRPEDLTMPTLFVAGELDLKYVAIAQELARRAPKGQVRVLADAGHAAHEDQPAAFIELVKNHVR